jgi:hypothetical protein
MGPATNVSKIEGGETFRESFHAFGLVTAGQQAVGEVAFGEHALAEGGLARPVHGLAGRHGRS